MSNTREIITLQFGNYSNYIGAHWWNIQECGFTYSGEASEINHDVLFREGKTSRNAVTYTPRMLLVDLNGTLGALPEQGDLYDDCVPLDKEDVVWNGVVDVQEEPKASKNEYLQDLDAGAVVPGQAVTKIYDLDRNVYTWTDYLYSRFHPRTINIVKSFTHGSTEVPFDTINLGENLWKTEPFQEDFSDRIRNYVEECNHIQGFHVLLDSTDGFAGLANKCMEDIGDEYSKNIIAIPAIANNLSSDPGATSIRIVNLVMCYSQLIQNAALFVPLSTQFKTHWRTEGTGRQFPYVEYKSDSLYHTSAILAAALDTITLPYRIKESKNYSIRSMSSDMTGYGRKMAAASLGLPFGLSQQTDLIDFLDKLERSLFTSLTPRCEIGTDKIMQIMTLRGVPESRLKKSLQKAGKQMQMAAYRCDSVKEMMELYLSCNGYATASNVTTVGTSMRVPHSYPKFCMETVAGDGFISPTPREENQPVSKMPVFAGLHNTPKIWDCLESLIREAERVKIAKIHRFKEAGLESDEYPESLENLREFMDCYEETFAL